VANCHVRCAASLPFFSFSEISSNFRRVTCMPQHVLDARPSADYIGGFSFSTMAAYNEKMPQVAETESAETGSDRQRNPRTFILVIFLLAIYRQGFFFLTLSDPSSASPRNEREREKGRSQVYCKNDRGKHGLDISIFGFSFPQFSSHTHIHRCIR